MQKKRLERQRKRIKFLNENVDANANAVKNVKSVDKNVKKSTVRSKEDFEESEEDLDDVDVREDDASDSESELGQDSDNESTASITASDCAPSSTAKDLFSAIFSDENTDLLNYRSCATPAPHHQLAIDRYAQVHDILKRVIVSTPTTLASQTQTSEHHTDGNPAKVPSCLEDPVDVNVDLLEKGEIHKHLISGWKSLNGKLLKKTGTSSFTPLQAALFSIIKDYRDVSYCNETQDMEQDIRNIYALHALNHIFKTRELVARNDKLLKLNPEGEHRDQGFTRPKVLVLLPFKNNAYAFINDLINLSGCKLLANKKRFVDEFGPGENTKANPRKPQDFNKTFAGNIDDCFKIGIKFSGKKNRQQAKLYAPFYSSDIIVASPLGLSMIIGAAGDKKRDFDFLSSLEVVILDQSNIFLMQNWSHVSQIFSHLNLIPKASHGCDFSRVRNYILDGHGSRVRQILCFSHFGFGELNALFTKYATSLRGKVKITQEYGGSASNALLAAGNGTTPSISSVSLPLSQVFYRISPRVPSLPDSPDARFQFFTKKILPMLRRASTTSSSLHQQPHTLILIPSFFDFTRVRNYLKDHVYNFAAISEYTSQPSVDRARSAFKDGQDAAFLLYTERYHFYRRTRIKGIRNIVFYGPPVHADFYAEIVNLVQGEEGGECSCWLLFDDFDRLPLERIVGTARMRRMVGGSKEAYMFSV